MVPDEESLDDNEEYVIMYYSQRRNSSALRGNKQSMLRVHTVSTLQRT